MNVVFTVRPLLLMAIAVFLFGGCGSSDTSSGNGDARAPNQECPVHYAIAPAPAALANDVAGYAGAPSGCADANGASCEETAPQTTGARILAWMPLEKGASLDRGDVIALMLFETRAGRECVDVVEVRDGRSSDMVSCLSTLLCSDLCFSQHRRDLSGERFIGGITVPEGEQLEIEDSRGQTVLHAVGPIEEGLQRRRAFLIEAPFRARAVLFSTARGRLSRVGSAGRSRVAATAARSQTTSLVR